MSYARLFTLDPDVHDPVAEVLSREVGFECSLEPLDLRTVKHVHIGGGGAGAGAGGYPLILLLHDVEGRTLLTDRDGLYNGFIAEAQRVSGGNYLLCLTGVPDMEGEGENSLVDASLVDSLVHGGGQESVQTIHEARRLLSWDELPSSSQIRHLRQVARGALPSMDGLPAGVAAEALKQRRRGGDIAGPGGGPDGRKKQEWFCSIL